MVIASLLFHFQAFKAFENLARQDDVRRMQELEEKLKKREEGVAAAAERMKVPVAAEEVEIRSAVEHNPALEGDKPAEPEKPLSAEEKVEADAANVVVEPPPVAAAATQPEEQSK